MTYFEELCVRAFIEQTVTAQYKLHIKPFNEAIDEYNVYCKPDEFMSMYAAHQAVGTITQEIVFA